MKKLTAMLLALLLAATLCLGALAEATGVDYTGTWTVTSIDMGAGAFSPATIGFSMSMVLNADGTGTMSALGVEDACTWAVTETGITTTDSEGTVDAYTLTDGQLLANIDGAVFTFTHGEAAEAPAAEAAEAAPLSGLALADFNGHWKLTTVRYMGTPVAAAMLGLTLDIELQDGKGIYSFSSVNGDGSVELLFEAGEAEGIGTMLMGYAMDENGEKADILLALMLYSDGTLVWDASDGETEMIYILELQAGEPAAE